MVPYCSVKGFDLSTCNDEEPPLSQIVDESLKCLGLLASRHIVPACLFARSVGFSCSSAPSLKVTDSIHAVGCGSCESLYALYLRQDAVVIDRCPFYIPGVDSSAPPELICRSVLTHGLRRGLISYAPAGATDRRRWPHGGGGKYEAEWGV